MSNYGPAMSFGPPQSGVTMNVNASVLSNRDRCAASGHRVEADDERLVYMDGVVVMSCSVCGERIQVAGIPTGDLRPRAKAVIDDLMNAPGDTFPVEVSESLRDISGEAITFAEKLAEIGEILRLATGIIERRWG